MMQSGEPWVAKEAGIISKKTGFERAMLKDLADIILIIKGFNLPRTVFFKR